MRYANVRRLDTWLREPKGLARDRLSDDPAAVACCVDRPAEKLRSEAYCDSKELSMFL